MAGLFGDSLDDPRSALMMGLAQGLLGARGYGGATFGEALGAGGALGMQGYQQAREGELRRGLLDLQRDEHKVKLEKEKTRRDALTQLNEDLTAHGIAGFTPEMLARYQVAGIDLTDIYKETVKKPNEFGLAPQVGLNPETGRREFFVQGRDGKTKWLGTTPPTEYQIFPPTEYHGPSYVDKHNPSTVSMIGGQPVAPAQTVAPMPAGGPVGAPVATGAPVVPRAPIPGLNSPKAQAEAQTDEYKTSVKRLDELRNRISRDTALLADFDKFNQLNTERGTGGLTDWVGASRFLPGADQTRQMEAITARLTPLMRTPGSGATSDYEMRQYRAGLPNIDNPGPTNKAISDHFRTNLTLGQRELAFKERWLAERGTLAGADAAWLSEVQKTETKRPDTAPTSPAKTVVRRGVYGGRRVVQYSDGTTDYEN